MYPFLFAGKVTAHLLHECDKKNTIQLKVENKKLKVAYQINFRILAPGKPGFP